MAADIWPWCRDDGAVEGGRFQVSSKGAALTLLWPIASMCSVGSLLPELPFARKTRDLNFYMESPSFFDCYKHVHGMGCMNQSVQDSQL